MAIPTFDQMLRPILALACEREITRRDMRPAMEEHFNLSPEDRAASIRSGETYVNNRTGWAMTFLTKAGLIDRQKLLDLMFEHRIGVRVEKTVEVFDLDQNYFEEE